MSTRYRYCSQDMLPLIDAKLDRLIVKSIIDCERLEEKGCKGVPSYSAAVDFDDVFQGSAFGICQKTNVCPGRTGC